MDNSIYSGLLTRNKVDHVSEQDQHQQYDYIEVIQALARLTYQSIYVINYQTMGFEYVSDNALFLCGYTAAEVLQMGYSFYFNNVPAEDLHLLNALNEAGFGFFDKLPPNERKLYTITYDFNLLNKDGQHVLINHKLTPLFLTSEQKMWKAMCIVSLSHNKSAGNVFIHKQGSNEKWELDTVNSIWHKTIKPQLSKRETEVLRLHAQGLTINQIAQKLFVAPDTVKYYRRCIFERLEVSNMVEALSYAVNGRII